MQKRIVRTAVILILSLCLGACGGIHFGEIRFQTMNDKTLMKAADQKMTTAEGAVILAALRNSWSGRYGEDIWNSGETAGELKDAAAVYLQNIMAAGESAVLDGQGCSESEEAAVQDAAGQYVERNPEADKDTAADAFRRVFLADRVFRGIGSAGGLVSDEEARVACVKQIFLPFSNSEEKADQKKKMDKIVTRIQEGTSYFNAQAAYYSASDSIIRNIARGELPADLEAAVFSLEKNQVSDLLEADDGYYLFQGVESRKEPESSLRSAQILKEKQEKLYQEALDRFMADNTVIWNESAWSKLSLTGETAVSGDGFFEIYRSCLAD